MIQKTINTNGINYIEPLHGSPDWYWGCDYESGDLYEAEDAFKEVGSFRPNRIIFVSYPEGKVYEPVKPKAGQYLSRVPAFYNEEIYLLMVDFVQRAMTIFNCGEFPEKAQVHAEIPLSAAKNCYNLQLATAPLMIVRQGEENLWQEIWPGSKSYPMESSESFLYREGDLLFFSKWYEDPDYREEIIVKDYHSGQVIRSMQGGLKDMPDGQKWILV